MLPRVLIDLAPQSCLAQSPSACCMRFEPLQLCIIALVFCACITSLPFSHGHPKLAAPFCRSWTVSVTQILLFASPLSTLYKAVVSRNSASFHLGLSIMSVISSAMWCIYGIVSQAFTHITHHSGISSCSKSFVPIVTHHAILMCFTL